MYEVYKSLSMELSRLTRDGTAEPVSRETKFLGAKADREIFFFSVQLTTSIGNLTRLIHTFAICEAILTYKTSLSCTKIDLAVQPRHSTTSPILYRKTKFSGANGDVENIIFLLRWPRAGLASMPA